MITYRKVASAYALAFLVGLSAIAPARALTDNAFDYTNKKTGYLALSPMDFAPDSDATNQSPWFNNWTQNALEGNGCFNTGIKLPDGANITNVRVMYEKGIYAVLVVANRETGLTTNMLTISRSLNQAKRVGYTLTLPEPLVVDNNKYHIGLGICVSPGQIFGGARVSYTYTTAGD